jgi:hypothetical protein
MQPVYIFASLAALYHEKFLFVLCVCTIVTHRMLWNYLGMQIYYCSFSFGDIMVNSFACLMSRKLELILGQSSEAGSRLNAAGVSVPLNDLNETWILHASN